MNLKLNYVKLVLIILALLACFYFNVYAKSSTTIGEDTIVATIKDENNNTVSLYLPESLNNDQCERRIYGTPTGVISMFETLYSQERRTESYEAAIRELCLQPGIYEDDIYLYNTPINMTQLNKELDKAGATVEEIETVLKILKQGALSIKKNFIKGGTLLSDTRNKIANVARKLRVNDPDSAFIKTCEVIGGISTDLDATKQITDIVAGSLLLNALATDNALVRLEEIERVVESEGKVDKALTDAVEQARINILASQDDIGAYAVYVNDHIRDITDSIVSLGIGLAKMAGKLSGPFAMWVGAPLMTYNTLKGISNQWEMAQDAVALATLTKMIEENSQGHEGITDNLTSYGQYAFYLKLEETFDVGMAKFHDFISIVGSTNRDWSQYYRQRKESTTIIAMKIDNFEEEIIQEKETLKTTYALRDTGPAGGLIFYDKGSYSAGWRYLEAAPASTEWNEKKWGIYYRGYILKTEWNKKQWDSYETLMRGTGTEIGTGQSNTTIIVIVMEWLNRNNSNSETVNAASLCDDLTEGGYSDWYLPSRNELNLMYENLKLFGVGDFTEDYYWSSSQLGGFAWFQDFENGEGAYDLFNYTHRVRAVRKLSGQGNLSESSDALVDTGSAGGYIFYDKGSYSDGWRYLEAAPVSTEWTDKEWGSYRTLIGGTETGIGTGKSNTAKIVEWLNSHGETDCAAQLCDALDYGGYNDWFLPSRDELNLMYVNLHLEGDGGFTDDIYWSSSEYNDDYAWREYFSSGGQYDGSIKDSDRQVRAVRAF